MLKLIRGLFSFDNFMITLATCVVIALLYVLPNNFEFLNPMQQALGDFELTDMVFSKFRDESETTVDTNVVIINIGHASRDEIAQIIENVQRYDPVVVGVDSFFRSQKDSTSDARLSNAIASVKNIVLVSKCAYKEESKEGVVEQWTKSTVEDNAPFDTLELSNPLFASNSKHGFSNLIVDQDAAFMTCRSVSLKEECAGLTEYSFPIMLAKVVNPTAVQKALQRNNDAEDVNFRGNLASFYHVDVDDALNPETDLSVVKNKVVMLGYMGVDLNTRSFDDNFFTPLNEHYVGRSYPDMYGVVIHANVVSMILTGNYIDSMKRSTSIGIALVVLFLNVSLFSFIYNHAENWYDTLALFLQLSQSLLVLYLTIKVFDDSSYKLDLTPTLACIALVGTVHDLYHDSIKKIVIASYLKLRRIFGVSSTKTNRTQPAQNSNEQV